MESEKRYKGWSIDQSGNPLVVLNDGANMEMNDAIRRLNDLEAERDDYRTALANRNNELDAVVKERDRYMAALERIELMDPDWTLGVDENMSRLQSIAGRALKGGGDE